jgi:hypothetical protein
MMPTRNTGGSPFVPDADWAQSTGMNHDVEMSSTPSALPAKLPRDPHISEAATKSGKTSDTHIGPDNTIGPSEVPADATLPPAEAVVPGKGRAPR